MHGQIDRESDQGADSGARSLLLRRKRLLSEIAKHGHVAVVSAGTSPPRNYPANTYDFRASSHFLYLVGASLPGAVLLLDGAAGRAELFVPPPAPDDALWHGELPSSADLLAITGVDS